MKKILLCWLAAATALTAGAQSNEWQDAGVNAVNRMPMHGSWFAYESPEAAQTGDKTLSERFVTLNGNWKFNWVRDADQRPTDFFRVGYNDKGWNDMPVPGLWELNGYGDPVYLNVGYAWRGWFKNDPTLQKRTEYYIVFAPFCQPKVQVFCKNARYHKPL